MLTIYPFPDHAAMILPVPADQCFLYKPVTLDLCVSHLALAETRGITCLILGHAALLCNICASHGLRS